MRIKKRSVVDTIYSAITPALVRFHWRGSVQRLILLLALLCSAKEEGFAKCGNVDYSWGADALASAHDYAVTMLLYIVYLCYAVAGIVVIVSALQIYIKMNTGEEGVKKNIMMLVGACLFLIGATIVFPAFFGYQI